LAEAWGKASVIQPPLKPPKYLPSAEVPKERESRQIDAEDLGKELHKYELGSATIINDGTTEAGSFAKQLEVGLRMAGWAVGGDNVKIGDPEFFPDSLTLEVSFTAASPDDHSIQIAKRLSALLEKRHVPARVRYTDLKFPADFIRIKVAGR
jgi:hypothetical protein